MDDPTRLLDDAYERQFAALMEARRGIVDVAASLARLRERRVFLRQQAAALDEQARQRLAVGCEDEARAALRRKVELEQQEQALAARVAEVEAWQRRLFEGETRLAARVETIRAQRAVLKAYRGA